MAGDRVSAPAVELTLGLPTLSREDRHACRRREARMKQMVKKRLLGPTPSTMHRTKKAVGPKVALMCVPCRSGPYVFPCWATRVVGTVPERESGSAVTTTTTVVGEGRDDDKRYLEYLGQEKNMATVTRNKIVPSLNNKKKELEEKMPYVIAKGDGPEGKTITGFLHRYTNTDVSIICFCHGRSFSPAEFLRHAGNSHTSQPLRHIVVVPPPARNK